MNGYSIIAIFAGAALATQATMNAHLGRLLGNATHATLVAFGGGFAVLVAGLSLAGRLPSLAAAKTVPVYLWFGGGLLGAGAVVSLYWLIPRLGMGVTTSFALAGQLVLAMIASHFGWFGLPSVPLTPMRIAGVATLVVALMLINAG